MAEKPVKKLTIRVSLQLYERLKASAEKDRRSLNQYVAMLLERAESEKQEKKK